MLRDHNIQPRESAFDPGPTIQDIDRDLADVLIATLERHAAALDTSQIQNKPWEALPLAQRKAMRAANELAKRQNQKEREDARAAEDAKAEARQQQRLDAQIADYKARARGAFPGTDAQFEAAWPRILEDYQLEHMRQHMAVARMVDF
jgi:multidrug efflux pump subunit AcrA (membrane-fusion protein)